MSSKAVMGSGSLSCELGSCRSFSTSPNGKRPSSLHGFSPSDQNVPVPQDSPPSQRYPSWHAESSCKSYKNRINHVMMVREAKCEPFRLRLSVIRCEPFGKILDQKISHDAQLNRDMSRLAVDKNAQNQPKTLVQLHLKHQTSIFSFRTISSIFC